MKQSELNEILENHKKWLNNEECGECADLSSANLRNAYLRNADLSNANLSGADLSGANLDGANLSSAYLDGANLSGADLSGADLRSAYLDGANLRSANLDGANLRSANLSGAVGLISQIDYLNEHFELNADGVIAYKTFGGTYDAPKKWIIQPGSVISETINANRGDLCGCGINVAPLKWVRKKYSGREIWKLLIRWEWLCGVVVPYNTDGKIRCERAELLEVVK